MNSWKVLYLQLIGSLNWKNKELLLGLFSLLHKNTPKAQIKIEMFIPINFENGTKTTSTEISWESGAISLCLILGTKKKRDTAFGHTPGMQWPRSYFEMVVVVWVAVGGGGGGGGADCWLKVGGGGAENTFSSLTLYNFHKSGRAEAPPPSPSPSASYGIWTELWTELDVGNTGLEVAANHWTTRPVRRHNVR